MVELEGEPWGSINSWGTLSSPQGGSVCVYAHVLLPSHAVSAMQQILCCVMQTKKSQSSSEMGMLKGWQSHWNPSLPTAGTGMGAEL